MPATAATGTTKLWRGGKLGSETDFGQDDNWELPTGAATVVPVSGDDVIVDKRANGEIVEWDIAASLNQNSKDFNKFVVGPNYKGKIGNSAADALRFAATDLKIERGASEIWLNNDHGSLPIVNLDIAGVGATGTGNISVAGSITNLWIRQGKLTIQSGTTALLDAVGARLGDVDITIKTATVTLLNQILANVTMIDAGTITTANVTNGILTVNRGTLTNLYSWGDQATTVWSTTLTMALARIFRGLLDAAQTGLARTISDISVFEHGALDYSNPADKVTLTASRVMEGRIVKPSRKSI